jgi:hypothetical protein
MLGRLTGPFSIYVCTNRQFAVRFTDTTTPGATLCVHECLLPSSNMAAAAATVSYDAESEKYYIGALDPCSVLV